jgi:predicted DNA-binding transcriptional regulator YafY
MFLTMADTPGRMLELLSLLQAPRLWSGSDLASRLEVTERTLRRDIERLRSLGYPVEAVPGRYGGYRLGRGRSLPPLMLNDDEAVAVAIGLREAVDGTVAGLEEAATSILAKLDQMMPTHVAGRVRALRDNTASMSHHRGRPADRVEAAHLVLFAAACEAAERVRFDYTARDGVSSRRLVEPIGLVRSGAHWYLAAWDEDRSDWRTFRLDRVRQPVNTGRRFERTDAPDPVALVTAGLASMPYPYLARILVPLPLAEASQVIPRTVALAERPDGSTVVEIGSTGMERMLFYLAGLQPVCEVLDPPELRMALAEHAAAVAAANSM